MDFMITATQLSQKYDTCTHRQESTNHDIPTTILCKPISAIILYLNKNQNLISLPFKR